MFRTAEGSKLLGIVMNEDVAFEIDGERRGRVERDRAGDPQLLDEAAAHRADDLPLRPWVRSYRYNVVEITPTAISGRRFELDEQTRDLWLGR